MLSHRQRPVRGGQRVLGVGASGGQTFGGVPCALGCRGLVPSGSPPRFDDFPGSVLSRVFLVHTLLTAVDGSCEPAFLSSSLFILVKEILNTSSLSPFLPPSVPPPLPPSLPLSLPLTFVSFSECVYFSCLCFLGW